MKTVLITGSSEGIGYATAELFLKKNYRVILHGLDEQVCEESYRTLKENHENIYYITQDLSASNAAKNIYDYVQSLGFNLDILVCNASFQSESKFFDIKEEDFLKSMSINVFRNIQLVKLFLPYMQENAWGRVIFVGSIHQSRPIYDMMSYASSKAALESVTKNLAFQYSNTSVTFNNIAPGFVVTKRNENKMDILDSFIQTIPSATVSYPIEVAESIFFLAQDNSKYITGTTLNIDGGVCI